jgi:hypothetical protein
VKMAGKSDAPASDPKLRLSFSQVEAMLSRLHKIDWAKRGAFVSRLKHLQKQGVPDRQDAGRGRSSSYSFNDMMQIAMALEVIQAGLPPQLAAALVLRSWDMINVACTTWLKEYIKDPEATFPAHYAFVFTPRALSDLGQEDEFMDSMEAVSIHDLHTRLLQNRRVVAISSDQLLRDVIDIAVELDYASVEQIHADLWSLEERHQRELTAIAERLKQDPAWDNLFETATKLLAKAPSEYNSPEHITIGWMLLPLLTQDELEVVKGLFKTGANLDPETREKFLELGIIRPERNQPTAAAVAVTKGVAKMIKTPARWARVQRLIAEEDGHVDPEA